MSNATEPPRKWKAIVPHDTNRLEVAVRALYFNGAGNVVLEDADGNTETFTVAAGQVLVAQPKRVHATGTTVAGIIGMA
ncbi:spike base protein, RCAP_Rcc01079 family [Aliikangiella coralliicola]|uniref:Uncharacterized protein n=1 Tax=Aliikangiella coralliicola TaxID=2592383 RepID=A0A545U057_9GAMM|nr:hypothetical protein [Aliikangiella coralliicola]TQV82847.1 hypothetical protein FLL46_24060 [Aliikangiella coralliicola]